MGRNDGARSTLPAALSETLISTDNVKETFEVSGWWWSKKVYAGTKDNTLYIYKPRCSWVLARELYAGDNAHGQPLFTIKEESKLTRESARKHPVRVTAAADTNGAATTTMLATSFWGIGRRFTIDGQDYQWRKVGPVLSLKARFVLEHCAGAGADAVLAEFVVSYLTHHGTFSICESEYQLPKELVLATGLYMEALLRKHHHGGAGGGGP